MSYQTDYELQGRSRIFMDRSQNPQQTSIIIAASVCRAGQTGWICRTGTSQTCFTVHVIPAPSNLIGPLSESSLDAHPT
jgi:hypothetical protein